MKWIQLEVRIAGEAEAAAMVADMVSQIVTEVTGRGTLLEERAPALVICGFLAAGNRIEQRVAAVRSRLRALEETVDFTVSMDLEVERCPEVDWAEAWKKHFRPQQVTERMAICPPWLRERTAFPGVSHVLYIDPGQAFGTGTHPTTVSCLAMLEQYLEGGEFVVDVGTGSGVLAIAALRLGAARVLAVDKDEKACQNAIRNLELNGLSDQAVVCRQDLLSGLVGPSPQVIVANILPHIIVRMIDRVDQILKPGGYFITSGIREEKRADFIREFSPTHLRLVDETIDEGWVALVFTREG